MTIGADAGDNRSVSGAFAIVTLPDATEIEVPLDATSSSHFEGSYVAPANPGASPREYSVVVYAEDDIGQRGSESAGGFVVMPPTGKLVVRPPASRVFGSVAIGRTATRRVVVRNSGGPRTGPIEASIATSGAPFALEGAVGGRIDFLLGPGKSRTFTVDFAPVSPGLAVGSAIVSREDGAQPDVFLSLSGRGVARRH